MSFKDYLNEQEELQILAQEQTKKQKLADFFRTMEGLNDDKFHTFAIDELGMEESEAETLVYKMLRDFLLAGDKNEDGIPDEMGAIEIGGDELGIGDEEGIERDIIDDGEVEADLPLDSDAEKFSEIEVTEI